MQRIKWLFFCLLISLPIFSQDLIVTDKGDSINCKITRIRDGYIYYTDKYKEDIRASLIPKKQTIDVQRNYFDVAVVKQEQVKANFSDEFIQFSLFGGYNYLIPPAPSGISTEQKQYINDLRQGYHIGGTVTYFIANSMGIGAIFTESKRSNSAYVNGDYWKDYVKVDFYAPELIFRNEFDKNKNALLVGIALGYLKYQNQCNNPGFLYNKITGGTVGLRFSAGADFHITKPIAISIEAGYLTGTLTSVRGYVGSFGENISLDKDSYEGLSQLELSIGLKLNIFR